MHNYLMELVTDKDISHVPQYLVASQRVESQFNQYSK